MCPRHSSATLGVLAALTLWNTCAHAQNLPKTCERVDVTSLKFSVVVEKKPLYEADPPEITIEPSGNERSGDRRVTAIVLGPALDPESLDDVKTDFSCTKSGVALTAIITHTDNVPAYLGTTKFPWRARFTVSFVPRSAEVIFQTTWKMQSTTGAELDHSPAYPSQKYPITITKALGAP